MDITAIIVMVAYLVAVTAIGSFLARKTTTASQWAIAGGGMGTVFIAAGIAGTRIGGAGSYGVAGNVMTGGVWYMWWYGINTFLALALVGIFFAVYYRRLGLHTVSEIFPARFGTYRNQTLTSLCVQTEYAIVNIIEAYVIGSIIHALSGQEVSMFFGTLIAAAIIVSYTALGGLWGTAVTNMIHCGVIIIGLGLVGVLGINQAGGWSVVTERVGAELAGAEKNPTAWWGFAGAGWAAVIGMTFSTAIHTPAASVYCNYAASAKSEKNIVPAFLAAGVIAALMPILAGLIGIVTLAKYGYGAGLTSYTNITQLATDINPIVGGIALAAVLAAVISSGGPILLSSATMFVRDWLRFTNKFDPKRQLKYYRTTTVIYGFLSAIAAWIIATRTNISILDMLLFGFAMVVPPAIAVGYVIYWRRTTEAAAFWGMAAGYAGGLIWFAIIQYAKAIEFTVADGDSFWRHLFHWCFVSHHGEGIDPSYTTTLVPLVLIPIISWLTPESKTNEDRFYAVASGKQDPPESWVGA
jgi:solute:Na+ symporter, SSS family